MLVWHMNLKKLERYLRVNLLGPGPRLIKKGFTGPRSHKGWETLFYRIYGTVSSVHNFSLLWPPILILLFQPFCFLFQQIQGRPHSWWISFPVLLMHRSLSSVNLPFIEVDCCHDLLNETIFQLFNLLCYQKSVCIEVKNISCFSGYFHDQYFFWNKVILHCEQILAFMKSCHSHSFTDILQCTLG